MRMQWRHLLFGLAFFFAAQNAAADVTGTWSGTYSSTTRCRNGVTRTDSGSMSLALIQTQNSVSGAATIAVTFLNDRCEVDEQLTLALPLSGGFSGNDLVLTLALPQLGDTIEITARPGATTMPLTFSAGDTTGTATLNKVSSVSPAGPLTGAYSGTFSMTPTCPNGNFVETGTLAFNLTHAGATLTGIGQSDSSRHVDFTQAGACFDHEIRKIVGLWIGAQVSGNSLAGIIVAKDDEDASHEEDIQEIEFTAGVSGNTITGGATTPDYRFTFTITRTSAVLPPSILSFSADAPAINAGQSAMLSWSTLNATSVSIDNGIGTQAASGRVTVTPARTTTYTLTASGRGGTATASTTVTIRGGTGSGGAVCNLSITLNCPPLQATAPTTCSATTINQGAESCAGFYGAGFFVDASPTAVSLTSYNSGLGLQECIDNTLLPDLPGSLILCFGPAALAPGAQFTQTVRVNTTAASPSVVPIAALTAVLDPATEEEKALVYVFDELTAPSCVPTLSAPAIAQSGGDYVVSWTQGREGGGFTLEESTTPDFSSNVTSFTVISLQRTFRHDVSANTTYYYRVRPNQCAGGSGAYSATASTVVQAPLPVQTKEADVSVPLGSTAPVRFPLFIPGSGTAPVPFTVQTDQPFLSVEPKSGTVGPSGTTVTVSASPSELPPGSNTGTVTATVGTGTTSGERSAANGATLTTAPVTISLVTPVSSGGKSSPPPNSLIVPVVTHVNGATGPFLSDVRLFNSTGANTQYQVLFTPSGSDSTTTGKATQIPATNGQTLALNDVVKNFFGFGATGSPADFGFGVLEIRPLRTSSTRTFASSRTYVRTGIGTLGQFVAAVPFANFASRTSTVPGSETGPPAVLSLQHVAQSGRFRTNLGIVEGSGSPANGRYRLYDAPGNLLKEVSWTLKPGEHRQMNNFIAGTMGVPILEDGRIEVIIDSESGAVTAYASVLDNRTTDPMAIMPVDASRIRARRYTIPGMAEFGGANNFHSDVRVYNGGTTSVTVTPTFYTINNPAVSRTGTPFTIAAGETKVFDNVLPTLFGSGVTAGSVVFTTAQDSSLVVTGRTYTIDPQGGTFGQFIPGLAANEGIGAGSPSSQLLQLEQSQTYRTNIGLVELTGEPVTVRLSYSKPDSKVSVSVELSLAGSHYTQRNRDLETAFGPGNHYNARVSVEVIGGNGRVAAYGSVLDNSTLDPTYVPAQ